MAQQSEEEPTGAPEEHVSDAPPMGPLQGTLDAMRILFKEGESDDLEQNRFLPHAHLLLLLMVLVVTAAVVGLAGI